MFSGNGIPFRNFGKFRRISLNFGRNLLNFEFENEIYRKIPKFRIPVTSGNEKFSEISPKLLTLVQPRCSRCPSAHRGCSLFTVSAPADGAGPADQSETGQFFTFSFSLGRHVNIRWKKKRLYLLPGNHAPSNDGIRRTSSCSDDPSSY